MNRKNLLQDVRTTARGLPLFAEAGDRALDELASIARCHDYPKNNILFHEGDPPRAAYLVFTGRVKIGLMNEEGREVVLSLIGPGGLFGLVAALDGAPQPANAITVAISRIASFSVDPFVEWLERHGMIQKVLRELSQQVREAYQKIGEHALMGVKERLLYALLDIAEREGTPDPGGEAVIFFTRPTHRELANRIGSSREVVSRVLKELLESELLQAEGRVIRVSESALVLREDAGARELGA